MVINLPFLQQTTSNKQIQGFQQVGSPLEARPRIWSATGLWDLAAPTPNHRGPNPVSTCGATALLATVGPMLNLLSHICHYHSSIAMLTLWTIIDSGVIDAAVGSPWLPGPLICHWIAHSSRWIFSSQYPFVLQTMQWKPVRILGMSNSFNSTWFFVKSVMRPYWTFLAR